MPYIRRACLATLLASAALIVPSASPTGAEQESLRFDRLIDTLEQSADREHMWLAMSEDEKELVRLGMTPASSRAVCQAIIVPPSAGPEDDESEEACIYEDRPAVANGGADAAFVGGSSASDASLIGSLAGYSGGVKYTMTWENVFGRKLFSYALRIDVTSDGTTFSRAFHAATATTNFFFISFERGLEQDFGGVGNSYYTAFTTGKFKSCIGNFKLGCFYELNAHGRWDVEAPINIATFEGGG